MANLPFSILFSTVLFFIPITETRSAQTCQGIVRPCGSPGVNCIEFPFNMRSESYGNRCGYPGFEVFCNNNNQNLMINLPKAGDFILKRISFWQQKIWINDPDDCLARRLLQGMINLADSPYELANVYSSCLINLTFLNCSTNPTQVKIIPCLSSMDQEDKYWVAAMLSDPFFQTPRHCSVISSVSLPYEYSASDTQFQDLWMSTFYYDIELQWNIPDRRNCQARPRGFSAETGLNVTCLNSAISHAETREGYSRKAKIIGFTLSMGITGLIIMVGCLISGKGRRHGERAEATGTEYPVWNVVAIGLDESAIEKYPITELDERGVLPNPNDNICAICLCEYQPKETLRTIPECNHYFHVNCIDGWLKVNATCPLCRK